MALLQQTLADMPVSQSPAQQNLLIVSFAANNQWITRAYDRTAAPSAVRQLLKSRPLRSTRSDRSIPDTDDASLQAGSSLNPTATQISMNANATSPTAI